MSSSHRTGGSRKFYASHQIETVGVIRRSDGRKGELDISHNVGDSAGDRERKVQRKIREGKVRYDK